MASSYSTLQRQKLTLKNYEPYQKQLQNEFQQQLGMPALMAVSLGKRT